MGIDYIPDYTDIILKEKGLSSPRQLNDTLAMEIREEALERKIGAQLRADNFVSDKGVIDHLAYQIIWSTAYAEINDNLEFIEKVKAHVKKIEAKHIILPFEKYPIEDNSFRNMNYYHQLCIHNTIERLYRELDINFENYDYIFEKDADEVLGELSLK